MDLEKIYFDQTTFHIIKMMYSDRYLEIYEYGRFNKLYERVNMKFKLDSGATTLQDLLNYMHQEYTSYSDTDELFITENDQHYVLNTNKNTLKILSGNKYSLIRCCYKNIYRTVDDEVYVLHDIELNELFVMEKSELDPNSTHICDMINSINMERSVLPTRKYNRIKHFQDQLQLIGKIFIDLDSPDEIEFKIKFHETPNFDYIKERCCIYNMMQYINNSHYYHENAKMKMNL